jgi:hypothetical protein
MRYLLLLLLTAPAFAGVRLVETPPAPPPPTKGATVLIPAPNVLYTVYLTGAGTRAVLTPEQGGVCWNRYKMFEVNRYSEAMRGCWSQSNGIIHIELQDGDRRAIPAVQFIQTTPEALRF